MIKVDGKIFAVGTTYQLTEKNGYNDSDFYATYLNFDTHDIDTIEYATTRFISPVELCDAFIDLTKENLIKWWKEGGKENRYNAYYAIEEINSKKPTKGKIVKVKSGRKAPIGVEGTIFWIKKVNYDRYHREMYDIIKIGIKDKDENIYWTYTHNVEVVDPDKYIDMQKVEKEVQNWYNELLKIAR